MVRRDIMRIVLSVLECLLVLHILGVLFPTPMIKQMVSYALFSEIKGFKPKACHCDEVFTPCKYCIPSYLFNYFSSRPAWRSVSALKSPLSGPTAHVILLSIWSYVRLFHLPIRTIDVSPNTQPSMSTCGAKSRYFANYAYNTFNGMCTSEHFNVTTYSNIEIKGRFDTFPDLCDVYG